MCINDIYILGLSSTAMFVNDTMNVRKVPGITILHNQIKVYVHTPWCSSLVAAYYPINVLERGILDTESNTIMW